MLFKKHSAALALGGGGARGLAHIGVLRALEKLDIRPAFIAGTSMGAIVGSLYALGMDAYQIETHIKAFLKSDAYRRSGLSRLKRQENPSALGILGQRIRDRVMLHISLAKQSVFEQKRLIHAIEELVPDLTFDATVIPFVAVASDIATGRRIELDRGLLRDAILASSSIPGVFPPLRRNSMHLLDGCVTDVVPVMTARSRAREPVIAVHVGEGLAPMADDENIFETLQRSHQITSMELTRLHLERADLALTPEVTSIPWYDFEEIDSLIDRGEACAMDALPRWRESGFSSLLRRFRKR